MTATATETKPDTEAKPAEGEAKPGEKPAKAEGAPEKYADFKLPEGQEIKPEVLEKVTPVFKELGLNQEQAQKLISLHTDVAKQVEDGVYNLYEQIRGKWREDVVKDATLGDGKADLKPEVKAAIAHTIDSLPAEVAADFRKALIETGAGDNPAFVKAFYLLSKAQGEGTLVTGGGPSRAGQASSSRPASPASAIYPNLPSAS